MAQRQTQRDETVLERYPLVIRDLIMITTIVVGAIGLGIKLGNMEEKLDRVVEVVNQIAPPTVKTGATAAATMPASVVQ